MKTGKAEHKLWVKEQMKNHPATMGVLSFRHKETGKQLVLSALNMEALVNRMRFSLNAGTYTYRELQADWSRDGAEAFEISVLATLEEKEDAFVNYRQELVKMEQQFVGDLAAGADRY